MVKAGKLLARWILIAGGFFALLWLCWYEWRSYIPAVNMIWVGENETGLYHLPFAISRLWDVGLAPVWATTTIFLFHKLKDSRDFCGFLWIFVIFNWLFATPGVILYSLILPLAFAITAGIIGETELSLFPISFRTCFIGSFAMGFASQLPICLWYGFAVGLVVSLAAGIIGWGGCSLAFGICSFGSWFSKNRGWMISWVLAKNGE